MVITEEKVLLPNGNGKIQYQTYVWKDPKHGYFLEVTIRDRVILISEKLDGREEFLERLFAYLSLFPEDPKIDEVRAAVLPDFQDVILKWEEEEANEPPLYNPADELTPTQQVLAAFLWRYQYGLDFPDTVEGTESYFEAVRNIQKDPRKHMDADLSPGDTSCGEAGDFEMCCNIAKILLPVEGQSPPKSTLY